MNRSLIDSSGGDSSKPPSSWWTSTRVTGMAAQYSAAPPAAVGQPGRLARDAQGRGSVIMWRGRTLRVEQQLSSGERGEERFEAVAGGRHSVSHAGLHRGVSDLL